MARGDVREKNRRGNIQDQTGMEPGKIKDNDERRTAMDKVLGLEVSHPRSNLRCHIDELWEVEGTSLVMKVVQQASILHLPRGEE